MATPFSSIARIVSLCCCALFGAASLHAQVSETEPNDSWPQANLYALGDTLLGQSCSGNEDWFLLESPDNGSLVLWLEATNTSEDIAGTMNVLLWRADGSGQAPGAQVGNDIANILPEATVQLGVNGTCNAPGFYWVQITGSPLCVSYRLVVTLLPVPVLNESEPNDTPAQANFFAEGDTVRGVISYVNSAVDGVDYWRIDQATHGRLVVWFEATNTSASGAGNYDFVGFHDGAVEQFSGFNSLTALPSGATASNTFTFECLAPGTRYLRVGSNGACGVYRLHYTVIPVPETNEVEPNNQLATAQPIAVGDTVRGHLAYYNGPGTLDVADLFALQFPDSARLRFHIEAISTNAATSSVQISALRPDGDVQLTQNIATNSNAYTSSVMTVDCYAFDLAYMRITAPNCHAYRAWVTYENRAPTASFTRARFGNTISYTPDLANVNTIQWQLGDGTTSNAQFPNHTFAFGNYTTTLTVTNTTCGWARSSSQYFELTGLESYHPKKGGRGQVQMQLYGGSLTNSTVVRITGAGGTFTAVSNYANAANSVLSAFFDLGNAPIGVYDLQVDIPGEGTITVPNGFTVEGLVYPECTAELVGPTNFLAFRPQLFRMVVRNTGNITAEGVVVGMAWPAGVTVVLGSQQLQPINAGSTTLIVDGEPYTISNTDLAAFHAVDAITPITQLNDEPYLGSIRSFIVPYVAPGGVVEIPMTVTSTVFGALNMAVYAHPLNMYHNGQLAPPWQNVIQLYSYELYEAIDQEDGTRDVDNAEKEKAARTAAQRAKDTANEHDQEVYEGQNTTGNTVGDDAPGHTEDLGGKLESAARTGVNNGGPQLQQQNNNIPSQERDQISKDRVDGIQKIIAENSEVQQQRVFPGGEFFGDLTIGQSNLERLNLLFGPEQVLPTQQELLGATQDELNTQNLAPEIPDGIMKRTALAIYKIIGAAVNFAAGAFDPNAIYGPPGVGNERYLSRRDLQPFTILFENVDTATAAAQEVFIETQLDLTRFDPATFTFGSVIIGGQWFNVPPGRQEFTMEGQLDPGDPYKVRINGTFNPAAGLVRWEFITLDLNTNNLPVFDGFLPPNVTSPEGEGSVFYTVRPWQTLPSNTTIESTASIVFDLNEAIITNTWSNTTDDQAPTSFASASVQVETITVELTGTDDASGIAYYEIFVSTNGGPWQLLAASTQPTAQLIGEVGSSYAFYCQAVDRVGNREVKEPIAEATVTLTGVPEHALEELFFSAYPNPTDGQLTITAMRPIHGAQLVVHDAQGRTLMQHLITLDADASRTFDLRALGAGTYTLSVHSASRAFGAKRVVVVK